MSTVQNLKSHLYVLSDNVKKLLPKNDLSITLDEGLDAIVIKHDNNEYYITCSRITNLEGTSEQKFETLRKYLNDYSHNQLFKYLRNGSSVDANGTYSLGAPGEFVIQPPAGEVYEIESLIITIADNSNLGAGRYGSIAELTNGIRVVYQEDGVEVLDFLDGQTIKSSEDWAETTYDSIERSYGLGDDYIRFIWPLVNGGKGFVLDGDENESIKIIIRDNLSSLNKHRFFCRGIKY